MIYHNNFIDNSDHVHIFGSYGNTWDAGYPSGGNFWSHYVDIDNYSGSYQNETGSDGIWDHPYVIDANNQDRYPLVNPWIMLTDDFSTDSGMWRFVESVVNIDTGVKYQGSAYRDSAAEYMVLTENRNYQAGVIWLNQDIFSPFIVEFKYKSGGGTGGDGLVFMFYKQKDYSPYDGGGLGFVTPPGGATSPTAVPGYGIEFDNYYNAIFNDPSENHIALIKDHVNNHLKYANDSRTEDNQWHNAKIIVGSSSVEVYLDGEVVFTWEGTIDRTYGGLGFAATTASRNNWHVINDVKITVNPWTPTHIWPMFQHDAQHTGSSPYIGPQSGNLLWSCNLGDHSIGPPVVGAEGTIYIPHQGLVALTPDGSIKWRAASGVYRSGTVTPVIASDGIIYGGNAFSWTLGSGTGFIYALDPGGRNLWGLDINLITSLTLASDGTIYAGTGYEGEGEATLYAVNPNGTVKWKFVSAPGRGWFRDSAIGLDGSIIASIVFSPSLETPPNPTIYALDPKDGSVKWQLELPFWTDISPPTIGPDGTIYLGTPSPHLEKGVLYAISSEGILKWTLELTDGTGMPAVASDGTIYVAGVGWLSSHESALFAIRPDGSIKWSYPVRVTSPPVIGGDGTIYFGALDDAGKNAVFALSSHGELKWKYLTDDLMNSPPCISGDGTLYIGSFDGTLYAFSPAPSENQPPTCSIELRKDEVKIDEIDVGEFFDIYVGDSIDDTGIKQVRFSSDDVQDDVPTGEWTEWFDWDNSLGDWNGSTKIKRWAFATLGYKEVWAEIKDDVGQTDRRHANIFARVLKVIITSPLDITPKGLYYVGDSLTAKFTVKNIGDVPVYFDVLTVGGRDPDGIVVDFEWERGVSLNPNDEHTYTGKLILPNRAGAYHFFCAYQTQYGYWNSSIDLAEGLTDEDRIEDIIVLETQYRYPLGGIIIPKEIFPEGKGHVIPIYVPPVIDNSNIIREDEGWQTIKEIEKTESNFEWEKMIASFTLTRARVWSPEQNQYVDTPQGAAFSLIAELITAVNNAVSTSKLKITIQEDSEGKFRAIIQMGDPDRNSFMRANAGGVILAEFPEPRWYFESPFSKAIAEAFHLEPDNYPFRYYSISMQIDSSHKTDEYIGYLSLSKDNRIILTPKLYPKDKLEIVCIHQFIFPYKIETIMGIMGEGFKNIMESSFNEEESKTTLRVLSPICLISESGIIVQAQSPFELRVYNSDGNITGMVNGVIREEIPNSLYSEEGKTVIIFNPTDMYRYEVVGIDVGIYGLTITSIENWEVSTFIATEIPITDRAIHQYSIDWAVLSLGGEGVMVKVDSNGDGIFEYTFTSDSELNHDEFVLQTETTMDFDPDTLNLKSKGEWVTAYIEFPEGYNVSDIDVSTMLLNGTIPVNVEAPTAIGDYDGDGVQDLMVKFDRAELIDYIIANVNMTELYEKRFMTITLTITGYLYNGTPFQANTTIRIVMPMPRLVRYTQFL
jgi:hypothetical protein